MPRRVAKPDCLKCSHASQQQGSVEDLLLVAVVRSFPNPAEPAPDAGYGRAHGRTRMIEASAVSLKPARTVFAFDFISAALTAA